MDIAVYGSSGHTARFVIAELLRRGHTAIAIGRDAGKIDANLASIGAKIETRIAALHDRPALELSLRGVDAVINAAGPYLDTAAPLVEAALAGGIDYVDLAAEQASAAATLHDYDARARTIEVAIVPSASFYGGLGDLLATHALDGWGRADRIDIAIALDRWWPTAGTRRTGERNTVPRVVIANSELAPLGEGGSRTWAFAQPFGEQRVLEVPFTETILIAHHLEVGELRSYRTNHR